MIWRYVERQQRLTVGEQVAARALTVRYQTIEGNPVLIALKRLLKGYVLLQRSANIFDEVDDGQLSRLLLATELREQLEAPGHDALTHARRHFDLVRKAAEAKKKLPPWLTQATPAQVNRFKRVQGRYLGCLLYTSPSPRDRTRSRMPSSA